MRHSSLLIGLLLLAGTPAIMAAQPAGKAIPYEYVSPGASGSINSSGSSQRYEIRNGVVVPQGHSEYRSGSSLQQENGGIRQTIRFPNGYEIPRTPGRSESYELQRNP